MTVYINYENGPGPEDISSSYECVLPGFVADISISASGPYERQVELFREIHCNGLRLVSWAGAVSATTGL